MMSNSIVRGLSVVSSPPNSVARAVPLLAPLRAKVDHLAELRDLLRRSHEAERELADERAALGGHAAAKGALANVRPRADSEARPPRPLHPPPRDARRRAESAGRGSRRA